MMCPSDVSGRREIQVAGTPKQASVTAVFNSAPPAVASRLSVRSRRSFLGGVRRIIASPKQTTPENAGGAPFFEMTLTCGSSLRGFGLSSLILADVVRVSYPALCVGDTLPLTTRYEKAKKRRARRKAPRHAADHLKAPLAGGRLPLTCSREGRSEWHASSSTESRSATQGT